MAADAPRRPVATAAAIPPLELCLRLAHAHALVARRFDNALSSLHGLSFGDFTVLLHLSRAPGLKLRRIDLAERLGLSASGVTRTLLPLEKLGLVARQSDPRDARVAHASLTKAGQRLLADARVTAEEVSSAVTQAASSAQIEEFSALLGRLAGSTSAAG